MSMQTDILTGKTMPEVVLLKVVWRWLWLVALFAALAAGGAYYWSKTKSPQFRSEAELLMRYGYEYTPPSSSNATDNMQVRVDIDFAISTDVQILSSPAVLAAALETAPAKDNIGWQQVNDYVGVSRIEGSNVVKVEVINEDKAWSKAYATAIIEAFLKRRNDLFSSDPMRKKLEAKRDDAVKRLAEVNDRLRNKQLELNNLTRTIGGKDILAWALLGSNLIDTLDRARGAGTGSQEVTPPPIDPKLTIIGRILKDFIAGRKVEDTNEGAGNADVSVSDIERILGELALLSGEAQSVAAAVNGADEFLRRLELRNLLDDNAIVLTPPQVSGRPVGPSTAQTTVLAAIGGGLAGVIFAFLLESFLVAARTRRLHDEEEHFGQQV